MLILCVGAAIMGAPISPDPTIFDITTKPLIDHHPTAAQVTVPVVPALGLSAATAGAFVLGAAGLIGTATATSVTCLFSAATGVSCPFCGLTHGVAALGAGDVGAAVAAHPLAPLAVALALAVPFVLLRGRRLEVPWAAPWALAALVAVVWLARVP